MSGRYPAPDYRPWLWLLAGPNGAGKSTYAPQLSAEISEIVNPDDIARQISPAVPEAAALSAGRGAMLRIRDLIKERRSFAVETTLSGDFHLRVARRVKSDEWSLGLVYVGLRSSGIAIGRVRSRRRKGGHHVPAGDIVRRYARSLRNLPVIYLLADEALIFDNSSARHPMKRVLEARHRRIVFQASALPAWLRTALGSALGRGRKRK